MSVLNVKTIIVDYQEWLNLQHKIDFLVDYLVDMAGYPCDRLATVYDQDGVSWCETNCNNKDITPKDCWHKLLDEVK